MSTIRLNTVVLALVVQCGQLLAQQYVISTFVGGSPPITPAQAGNSFIGVVGGLVPDENGNIYFASLHSVFMVSSAGVLTRVAGTSRVGYSGDGGPATAAQLNTYYYYFGSGGGRTPMAISTAGDLFLGESGAPRIRKINRSGIISTIAGTGGVRSSGDGGPAAQASFEFISDLAFDNTSGALYVVDRFRIRKISSDGVISTVDNSGNDPLRAHFHYPAITIDNRGILYIVDQLAIRTISPTGEKATYVVLKSAPYSDNSLEAVVSATIDGSRNIYVAFERQIKKVSPTGVISQFAGPSDSFCCLNTRFEGDGGNAISARFSPIVSIRATSDSTLFVADSGNGRVRRIAPNGIISTIAGNGSLRSSGDGGPATAAFIDLPTGVVADRKGNVYFIELFNGKLRRVARDGTIITVSSNLPPSATSGITVDSGGNVYFSVADRHIVARLSPTGEITNFAGTGTLGASGDGGTARSAQLSFPFGLAADSEGNIYIADTGNAKVRKVSTSGIITTVVGNGTPGYSGDGGLATAARLGGRTGYPLSGLAMDKQGNLYIADVSNNRVRKVTASGIISTIVGNGSVGFGGDGGPAVGAQLHGISDVAVDLQGNLFLNDIQNVRVRRVNVATGIISTVAGNGVAGYSGDGGPATNAQFLYISGIGVDEAGKVYVGDIYNNAIRSLEPRAEIPNILSIVNAASNLEGPVAPGEIVVIFGNDIGPNQLTTFRINEFSRVGTSLGGTSITFNNIAAPLIYTWSTQVAAIVPYGVTGSNVEIRAVIGGIPTAPKSTSLAAAAPGLFTLDSSGKGQVAAINQDGSINSVATPESKGNIITLFATGEGRTTPDGTDGKPASIPLPRPQLPVEVTIGGRVATLEYAGGAPSQVAGVMQINARIPADISSGSVPVVFRVGGVSSAQFTTIAVK